MVVRVGHEQLLQAEGSVGVVVDTEVQIAHLVPALVVCHEPRKH